MKDIIITTQRQKTELKFILISFVLALVVNAIGVLLYDTQWCELYTQWLWDLIFTGLIYGASIVIRLMIHCFKKKKS
ncbi:MAG: hypothetical protein M0P33_10325 [Massilibacteroides sp.]|nr:hypothetical protein [Massilibacteroides sp.]